MLRPHRSLPIYVLSAALLMTAPACATGGYYGQQRGSSRDFERRAYQNGFEDGMRSGQRDARDRRDFSYGRDGEYRSADRGYSRAWGDRDDYRRTFRQGYEAGYTEGFNRVARAFGGGPRGTYPAYPNQYPAAPRVGNGVYRSPAHEVGYRDGYEAGRNDVRDRERFDPLRSKRYRSGDREYDNRYGSREDYKREYRAAFQQGYDQGYRESRR